VVGDWLRKRILKKESGYGETSTQSRKKILTKEDLENLTEEEGHQLFQFSDDGYELVSREDPNYYQNHSCDPNCWFIGADLMVTRRSVKKGEELTYDYCLSESTYDEPFFDACGCGTKFCRGTISSEDYKNPALHERYGNHFLPYILKKIENLKK